MSAALNAVIEDRDIDIDPDLGHCHNNLYGKFPGIVHGATLDSFQQELDMIKTIDFRAWSVFNGHYRNLVGLRSAVRDQLGNAAEEEILFIKITVDSTSDVQVRFITSMLEYKAKSFPDLTPEQMLFRTKNYIESWYWVENVFTHSQTLSLKVEDVFTPGLAARKLTKYLTADQVERFDLYQRQYLDVQARLYPDIMRSLT